MANGNPFPFVAQPAIADIDDTLIEGATVTLTDGADGDFFFVPAPALEALGIGFAITGEAGGPGVPLTVTLTGSASLANYQDALQQIGFGTRAGFRRHGGDERHDEDRDEREPEPRVAPLIRQRGDIGH